MKRNIYKLAVSALVVAFAMTATAAVAAPNPDGANFNLRIFDDCFTSTLNTTNNYPALVQIDDDWNCLNGWANLHNWHLSEGGAEVEFDNADGWEFAFDLVLSGPDNMEAGMQIAPWWSQDVDGRFNIRSTDGEIACFGGRLPFYSFTANDGINYVKGETIGLKAIYCPNSLDSLDAGTIEYIVNYGGSTYSSGPLAFSEGNPSEDPPHGLWGLLTPHKVGGYVQTHLGGPGGQAIATYTNITYSNKATTATENTSWGEVKSLFR
ncbi:MAG: hypothetical protein HKN20_02710 [Gemmatimonadetes bacterium]|nr:hypothetical protein [Gemmatimonadota bacterium]